MAAALSIDEYSNLLHRIRDAMPDEVLDKCHILSKLSWEKTGEKGFVAICFGSSQTVEHFISHPNAWNTSANIVYIAESKATEAEKIMMHHMLDEYDPQKSFVLFLSVKMNTHAFLHPFSEEKDENDTRALYSIVDVLID